MFVTIRRRLAQVAQFFELVDGLVDTQRFTRGSSSRRATPSSSPVMKACGQGHRTSAETTTQQRA